MKETGALRAALRGASLASSVAPALVASLVLSAAIASAAASPTAASLHAALDRLPGAASLATSRDAALAVHLALARPALAGATPWAVGGAGGALLQEGALGSLLALALASAAVSSVLAGGFASRLASRDGRRSLPDFAADAVRFAPSSLLLGALSLGLLLGLFRLLVMLPARFAAEISFRYEWEAVLLRAGGGILFLVAGALARSAILAARGAMGTSGRANPVAALWKGLNLVVGRPGTVLSLEALFALAAILPPLLWAAFSPTLPGWQGPLVDVLGQEVVLFLSVGSRVAHLGALQSLAPAAETA